MMPIPARRPSRPGSLAPGHRSSRRDARLGAAFSRRREGACVYVERQLRVCGHQETAHRSDLQARLARRPRHVLDGSGRYSSPIQQTINQIPIATPASRPVAAASATTMTQCKPAIARIATRSPGGPRVRDLPAGSQRRRHVLDGPQQGPGASRESCFCTWTWLYRALTGLRDDAAHLVGAEGPHRGCADAAGCAGQAGAGRACRRCQQVRNASFHGQSGLILRTRWRAWRTRRAGMCQSR